MNYRKIVVVGIILGTSMMASLPIYATSKKAVENVVECEADRVNVDGVTEEVKETYRNQCYDILKNYFGLTKDQLPKDATFEIMMTNKKAIDIETVSSLGYNNVSCMLNNTKAKDPSNGYYMISIDPANNRPYFALVPMTDKGWELQKDTVGEIGEKSKEHKVDKKTEDARKKFCESYIKKLALGDIENPVFVKISGATYNHYIYKDSKDSNKCVMINFDPSQTTKVTGFDTRYKNS